MRAIAQHGILVVPCLQQRVDVTFGRHKGMRPERDAAFGLTPGQLFQQWSVRQHMASGLDVRSRQAAQFETECLKSVAVPVSYTHLRAHETRHDLVCRLLLEK